MINYNVKKKYISEKSNFLLHAQKDVLSLQEQKEDCKKIEGKEEDR